MEIVKLTEVTESEYKILSNIHVVNISEIIKINPGIYINKRVTFNEDVSIIQNTKNEYTDTDTDTETDTDTDTDLDTDTKVYENSIDEKTNKDTDEYTKVDEKEEKMHNTINLRQLVYNFILKYLYKIKNLWTT